MARANKPAPAEPESTDEPGPDEVEEPALFGPYELVEELDGEPVNRLAFGADPVVFLHAGEQHTTSEPRVAAFLDAHPLVRKKG